MQCGEKTPFKSSGMPLLIINVAREKTSSFDRSCFRYFYDNSMTVAYLWSIKQHLCTCILIAKKRLIDDDIEQRYIICLQLLYLAIIDYVCCLFIFNFSVKKKSIRSKRLLNIFIIKEVSVNLNI